MKRAPLTLAAAAAALAAVTGIATLTAPAPRAAAGPAATREPVVRSTLACPAPSTSDIAETAYTSYTPAGTPAGTGTRPGGPGGARLVATGKDGKQLLELKEPGKPAAATASGAEAPAMTGTADGPLAPGWTAQQTTKVAVGQARGLLGVACTAPGTEFWFPGASTAQGRTDYLHLTSADGTGAEVDVELFGPEGELKSKEGTGAGPADAVRVHPRSSEKVLLSELTSEQLPDVTVRVTARTGRVAATVQVTEDGVGADWLPAATAPAGSLVLPGIPADATSVRLVVHAPGEQDADLRVRLAGPGGPISPAGHEQLHVKAGSTASVDLKDVTRGEPGSLLLTPSEPRRAVPVVAALRVVRGGGAKQELGLLPASGPAGPRATVADNRADQGATTLSLTAVGADARVRVTASPGTEGGAPASQEYTVKADSTLAVAPPPVPGEGGKGAYALTVETLSGGPVHAARTLSLPHEGIAFFTVQTLADDRSTVVVPRAVQDLAVLDD
ncbi:DUF5719 family protein [Streptomyces sp. NPDC012888]|uniref:DUF5719 family protein n=1 Tax=Streptomyces sp. NPDC012888 TaxID=3364855 RepID=UPI0036AABE40